MTVLPYSGPQEFLKLQMGDLGPGDYRLSVSGWTLTRPEVQFRNSSALRFEPKSLSVFVETDKPVYGPGDLVRFRAVIVGPSLRPTVTGAIDVHVEDGGGVAIQRFPRVFTTRGVFAEEVQLSPEPVLGNWTIVVSVLGQEYRGGFYVAQLVPPKFEVLLGAPDHLSLQDQLTVTVAAHYPHGRPIVGEVTLQVTPRYQYNYLQAPYDQPYSVVTPIEGKTSVTLDLVKDLGFRNATRDVTVHLYPNRMTFTPTSPTFKPGLPYTAYVSTPTSPTFKPGLPYTAYVSTTTSPTFKPGLPYTAYVSKNPFPPGLVQLVLSPPLEGPGPTYTLGLEATYGALTQWLGEVPRAHSPTGAFLQASVLTPAPTVGEEVLVALNATERLGYFTYQVLARGEVLYSSTLQAHRGTSHAFRFIASPPMFPRARLLVHYVRPDGEVVADAVHFPVARGGRDKVVVSVTPTQVDAATGGRVAITVAAKPNSLVGVSSMDARTAAMLGANHRMDATSIMDELETYDPGLRDGQSVGHIEGLIRRTKRDGQTSALSFSWAEDREKRASDWALLGQEPQTSGLGPQTSARPNFSGDQKFWAGGPPVTSTEGGDVYSSMDVEWTSYALLTYVARGLTSGAAPVARWLTAQRRTGAAFTSTHDSVVATAALAALGQLWSDRASGETTVKVVYGERGHRFAISPGNSRNLQTLKLPETTASIDVSASGNHLAIVQLTYSYNVKVSAPRPAFSLDPQLDRTTDTHTLRLTTCTGLIQRPTTGPTTTNTTRNNVPQEGEASGMAVMEVALPSGYIVDHDTLPGLYDYPGVRRVEPLRGDDDPPGGEIRRGVAIYFDSLTPAEACPTVVASRVDGVAHPRPAGVRVYDVYAGGLQGRQFYTPHPSSLCDICDPRGECGGCPDPTTPGGAQPPKLDRQRQDPDEGFAATVVETSGGGAPPAPFLPLLAPLLAPLLLRLFNQFIFL
ncbi:CD109 antigen [Hyalella azteca]|uniref:CD109 antigen n=1 Tax=Hyalella azteca TaxID=294128 RepID=A0A8B7NFC1_HYAAZ|nr:CD109 antigen [Hyalella azteca]